MLFSLSFVEFLVMFVRSFSMTLKLYIGLLTGSFGLANRVYNEICIRQRLIYKARLENEFLSNCSHFTQVGRELLTFSCTSFHDNNASMKIIFKETLPRSSQICE